MLTPLLSDEQLTRLMMLLKGANRCVVCGHTSPTAMRWEPVWPGPTTFISSTRQLPLSCQTTAPTI